MLRRRFKLIKQGDTLSDLTDVDTTGATSGQVLIWNGTEWVPADITAISLFDESVQDIIGSKLLSGIGLTGTYDDAGAGTYTIDLDHLGIEDLADPNADRIMFWDDSAGYVTWLTAGTGLTLSGTTLTSDWLTVGTDTIWDAKGDLAVGTGANTASKLTVGTDGYVLTADSAQPTGLKWAAGGAGAVATDTIWDAKGDLAVGTGADTASKLTVGTDGYVLTADSTTGTGLKWAAAPGGGVGTDTIWDAKGDLAVGTGADTAAKLTVGVNGYYLVADSGEATGLKWAAGPTGSVATDAIWDAKGDMAIGTGADTAAKLTVGINGYVLTADSAEATGVKWAAAAAGSVATDTIWDAKGDLAVGTGANTASKLTAGTDGYYLVTDSAQATGLKWAALGAINSLSDVDTSTTTPVYGDKLIFDGTNWVPAGKKFFKAVVLADTPSAFWLFDDASQGSGNTITDYSGNSYTLTITGADSSAKPAPWPNWGFGEYCFFSDQGGAVTYASRSDYCGDTAPFGDFSIMLCAQVERTGTTLVPAGNGNFLFAMHAGTGETEAENVQAGIYFDTGDTFDLFWEYGAGTNLQTTGNSQIIYGGEPFIIHWTRNTATRTFKYYINGMLIYSGTYTGTADPTGGTGAGKLTDVHGGVGTTAASDRYWGGPVAYWNGTVLTDAQIQEQAQAFGTYGKL